MVILRRQKSLESKGPHSGRGPQIWLEALLIMPGKAGGQGELPRLQIKSTMPSPRQGGANGEGRGFKAHCLMKAATTRQSCPPSRKGLPEDIPASSLAGVGAKANTADISPHLLESWTLPLASGSDGIPGERTF